MEIDKVIEAIQGKRISDGVNSEITSLCIDSRTAKGSSSELFLAFKGVQHDGHKFLSELYQKGTRNFIVEKEVDDIGEGCNVIKVDSSLEALQRLATANRTTINCPVVGITGSNGKTITKEWLATILDQELRLHKSPGSFNSQIGVALSVWQLQENNELGIFEAGISMPGEMEKLASIIQPTLGLLTNIGVAHDEFFESKTQKAQEKLLLFSDCPDLIFRNDDPWLEEIVKQNFDGNLITWSLSNGSTYQVAHSTGQVSVSFENRTVDFHIPFTDEASLENLTHAIIASLELGLDQPTIQDGINQLNTVHMRLELKKGINDNYIIDDSYTNDLAGLEKALDFMDQHRHLGSKALILSDFAQVRDIGKALDKLKNLLSDKGIGRFIGVGPELVSKHAEIRLPGNFYNDTNELLASGVLKSLEKELILIKGARKFKFERLSNTLTEKTHKTVLEINLNSVVHNLNYYRSLLKPQTKLMVMVKALAYGSGSIEIARLLQYHKVDYLAVAYTDEGAELRKNGITLPIMVMNATPDEAHVLIENNLEPEIFGLSHLKSFMDAYAILGHKVPAHMIFNTGMNRLGFEEEDISEIIQFLKSEQVIVKSLFTHLAVADDANESDFTSKQIGDFNNWTDEIAQETGIKVSKHVLNSAGIANYPEHQMDMVRLGIGLHGIDSAGKIQDNLIPTTTFKTVVSQIREIEEGDTIGYGRAGKVTKKMKIGTIAMGYADGYSRSFGNGQGHVLVNGEKAPTIGNICMDMTMVDLSSCQANEGDEVIVFGENPSINQLAQWAESIPYEIMTNVSSRVKRVYYSE